MKEKLSRRDVVKAAGVAVGGGVAGYLTYELGKFLYDWQTEPLADDKPKDQPASTSTDKPTQEPTREQTKEPTKESTKEVFRTPQIPEFPGISIRKDLIKMENWNADGLKFRIDQAIQESIHNNRQIEINLPKGECVVDKLIQINVPNGADIKIIGSGSEKTRLRQSQERSVIPEEWGGHGLNLLELVVDGGKIELSDIEFDGGSDRAGDLNDGSKSKKYMPPLSPWDSVVYAHGNHNGEIVVNKCKFTNSESVGLITEGLKNAQVSDSQGRNLDGLWTANWCDAIKGKNLHGENCLSDGLYLVECQNGEVADCIMKTCRQAYDIHGCSNLTLTNCHSLDSSHAFVVSKSERNQGPSRQISFYNCESDISGFVYAIGFTEGINIKGGSHDQAGGWFAQKGFLYQGVRDYDAIGHAPLWIHRRTVEKIEFENIKIRKSDNSPSDYSAIPQEGIGYFGFDKEKSYVPGSGFMSFDSESFNRAGLDGLFCKKNSKRI